MSESQEFCRVGTCHACCLRKVDAEHRNGIAHRAGHIDGGTGQRTILVNALAVANKDLLALQQERALCGADARHRVGHQHETVVSFATQCYLQNDRRHMMAIDNDAAPAVCVMQGSAYDTGIAAAQR